MKRHEECIAGVGYIILEGLSVFNIYDCCSWLQQNRATDAENLSSLACETTHQSYVVQYMRPRTL